MVENETQTEELQIREAITQTNVVELCEEDCQTEDLITYEVEIQVNGLQETVEMGTGPDTQILEKAR